MSLGFTEIMFLMVILLLFFGPSKLPGIGKSLGETMRSFKKSMEQAEIDVTDESKNLKKKKDEEDA